MQVKMGTARGEARTVIPCCAGGGSEMKQLVFIQFHDHIAGR